MLTNAQIKGSTVVGIAKFVVITINKMPISNKYIVVEKLQEEKKEGFQSVEVQDSYVYKGKVVELPDVPVYISNHQVVTGDVVIWAKYSPDTHEIEGNKFVAVSDLLKVL